MRLHRFLILGICLVGLLTLTLSTKSAEKKGSKYAILIGVNKYDRDQLTDLECPVNDVTAFRKVLIENCGFKSENVQLMTLDEAGRTKKSRKVPFAKNIRDELKSLIQLCDENDTLIIAFAGHGIQFKNDSKNYFCPADAKLEDRKTLIDLKQVYQDLTTCDARVKLLFVDACRNDPRTKEARSRPSIDLQKLNNPQRLKLPKGVAAFFSCQAGQESFEDRKTLGHGVFFHFVMEGLRGKAASDGKVTLPDLQSYVRRSVKNYVHQNFSRRIQKPQLTSAVEDVITLASGRKVDTPPDKPTKLTKDITNSIGMKLKLIPAGTFMMGSPRNETDRRENEGPQHEVEITRSYYMGVYEVTQAEFEKVMGYNPSYFSRNGKEKAGENYYDSSKPSGGKESVQGMTTTSFPVENVSWDEAVEFCKKLSAMAGEKRAGRVYRLPTEAEWEYACRGGSKKYQVFAFGNSLSSKQANFDGDYPYGGAEKGIELSRTCKVGSYSANGFGLFDMHGNVWEWCSDFYSDETYTKGKRTDPTGPKTGDRRSLRGGSWVSIGSGCRSAYRLSLNPDDRDRYFGFRVVFSAGK